VSTINKKAPSKVCIVADLDIWVETENVEIRGKVALAPTPIYCGGAGKKAKFVMCPPGKSLRPSLSLTLKNMVGVPEEGFVLVADVNIPCATGADGRIFSLTAEMGDDAAPPSIWASPSSAA